MKYSIVIRSFNEEKNIGRLLSGIFQQTVREVEIILVDSGSIDSTISIAKNYPIKILHIEPEEFTFGRSLNRGIAEAEGDVIVIASAHVYPTYPDWLEQLILPFYDSKVALVYGRQRGGPKTLFSEHQIFAHWYPKQSQPIQKDPFCNNANSAILRRIWNKHKYDESLTGLEDLEWASWALGQGYFISYVAEAEVIHVHNETPWMIYNRYKRESIALKRIFPKENFDLKDFIHLSITNIYSDILQAVRHKELKRSLMSVLWFRLTQFWGTYQGYRYKGTPDSRLRRIFYYPQFGRNEAQAFSRTIEPIHYIDQKQ